MNNLKWMSVRNKLSYENVIKVEQELKTDLPKDYLKLIGEINGGALKDSFVHIKKLGNISYSRNVSLDKNDRGNIFLLFDSFQLLNLFPFASVGNGDYFCFDLSDSKVVLWRHELNDTLPICESFTELMKMIEAE